MKNYKNLFNYSLLVLLSAVLINFASCKEDNLPAIIQKSTLSFTVNGQGYNNQVMTYESNILGAMQMMSDTIVDGDTLGGTIIFFPSNTVTTPKASLALQINGGSTGTFNWPIQSQLIISFSYTGDSTKYVSATDTSFASKTIISSYGAVSEKVIGTFSGTCVSADTTLRTITISNGQFDLVRKK